MHWSSSFPCPAMGFLHVNVVFLVGFVTLCHCLQQPTSGLYNITVTSMSECENRGTHEVKFHTKMSKMGKNKVCYSGWMFLPYGMTDEGQEVWEISTRGSTGGWKANFLSFRNRRACSDTKRLFPQWFNLFKKAHLNDTSCPIPKGNYSFTCVDLSNLQFERSSIMVYGIYRVTVKYYQNDVLIGCNMYQGDVHPRVKATEHEE